MASRSRSVTPSRRYGDIIGSIFSNGSGELEEKKKTSVSQVKQKFRERRQQKSPRRGISRSHSDEQRQNPSSPTRQYNEARTRTNSRPPTPDRSRSGSRPPTPDRTRSNSRPPTPDRNRSIFDAPARDGVNRDRRLSASQLEPFQTKAKGISLRPKSTSPQKRRHHGVESSGSWESLTSRVAKQVSKSIKKTIERDNNKAPEKESRTYEQNESMGRDPHTDARQRAGTQRASAPVSYSPGNVDQMKEIIQAQNDQIKFFEECLMKRSSDIQQLTLELKMSKKNESKLNLELEIHDLKYSMYDDYRRTMDRERLENTSKKDGFGTDRGVESSVFSKSRDAFAKLNELERLYEKSKLEAESRFSILRNEYNRMISAKSDGDSSKEHNNDTSAGNVATSKELLENRIKILQSENSKYSRAIKEKEQELEKAKSIPNVSISGSRKDENLSNRHNFEKQTLQNKISALETEIGFTSGQIDDKTRTRRYRALEKNLNDYVAEIMGLEDQLKEKEKIISKLKEKECEMILESGKNGSNSQKTVPWYEQTSNRHKGPTVSWDHEVIGTSRTFDSDTIDAVSTDIQALKNRNNNPSGSYRIGVGSSKTVTRKSANTRGRSGSSTRIAMLRKRLDALATDHGSIGTEETQRSNKTSPS
eukprot:CAMPEP_0116125736 /NCGR_PEP_ID=MMETSP0329-20121206/5967_1 /TAXON_ID=697910 /ORGANISM="Pseudo-nitzschia arenysensis, Strain B593" /LENGTH=647 /DNA_ID=CAMNT_0003619791 /DNA_START=170 /DNA_END=2113 /DNA_ORIENTATION=+